MLNWIKFQEPLFTTILTKRIFEVLQKISRSNKKQYLTKLNTSCLKKCTYFTDCGYYKMFC